MATDEHGFPMGVDFVEDGCVDCGRSHHVHRTTEAERTCAICQEWTGCMYWEDRQREAVSVHTDALVDRRPDHGPGTAPTRQIIESHTTAPYSHVVP